jgi:3-dehydroquinate dehydratase/shikimate dehydrogenase
LANGLAYADADRRRNFAYVDLEDDLDVPSLEEAARTFHTRIIRSWHNMDGVDDDLAGKLKGMRRVGDELVKAAVMPHSLNDVIKVFRAAQETKDMEKILSCMGVFGTHTRILAEHFGSRICYTSVQEPGSGAPAVPGQLPPKELAEFYRFREITEKTKLFAVSGFPLKVTESPRFFNPVFEIEQTDAVYIPIIADSIHSLMQYAEEIGFSGISVTIPYKQEILPYLKHKSPEVISIGACNTAVASPDGWKGYNTDGAGFSSSLLSFIKKKDLRGKRITIVGAGGAARAVAAEVYRLKGKALVLNRTPARARSLASAYRFAWAALDSQGADMMYRYSDIIIQASPVGMNPQPDADPIDFYKFSGKEIVMDLIYKPEKTRCLKRAEEAGCRTLNGSDMLHRQARLQYGFFMGKEFPPSLISRIKL